MPESQFITLEVDQLSNIIINAIRGSVEDVKKLSEQIKEALIKNGMVYQDFPKLIAEDWPPNDIEHSDSVLQEREKEMDKINDHHERENEKNNTQ